ncbi:glycosyltransferase [Candidatus Uhrbacteria bacterium]|nr:glycosyltransferase [Candidatus Uhrbacteria bacterium]
MEQRTQKKLRLLFTGGGTLGSVTPLLAIYEELQKRHVVSGATTLWIGTRKGVEEQLIREYMIPFRWIYAGKLRRYFSLRNFLDPFLLCLGLFQSLYRVARFRPDVIVGAGGYVSVPVMYAGWFWKKKICIFQLDIEPTLSNLIVSRIANAIGVACEEEVHFFPKTKTSLVGIPVREAIRQCGTHERNHLRKTIGVTDSLPVMLALGGGTGSLGLNTILAQSVSELSKNMHIFHITGHNKQTISHDHQERYHHIELAGKELPALMAAADVVVTRAGLGTLSELSYLGKPTIIIPLPNSHQERNAAFFEKKGGARYLGERYCTPEKFVRVIRTVLQNADEQKMLSGIISQMFPRTSHELCANLVQETAHI